MQTKRSRKFKILDDTCIVKMNKTNYTHTHTHTNKMLIHLRWLRFLLVYVFIGCHYWLVSLDMFVCFLLFLTTKRISMGKYTILQLLSSSLRENISDLIWSQSHSWSFFSSPKENSWIREPEMNEWLTGLMVGLIVFQMIICIFFFGFVLFVISYHLPHLSLNFFYTDHFLLNDRFINFDNDLSNFFTFLWVKILLAMNKWNIHREFDDHFQNVYSILSLERYAADDNCMARWLSSWQFFFCLLISIIKYKNRI